MPRPRSGPVQKLAETPLRLGFVGAGQKAGLAEEGVRLQGKDVSAGKIGAVRGARAAFHGGLKRRQRLIEFAPRLADGSAQHHCPPANGRVARLARDQDDRRAYKGAAEADCGEHEKHPCQDEGVSGRDGERPRAIGEPEGEAEPDEAYARAQALREQHRSPFAPPRNKRRKRARAVAHHIGAARHVLRRRVKLDGEGKSAGDFRAPVIFAIKADGGVGKRCFRRAVARAWRLRRSCARKTAQGRVRRFAQMGRQALDLPLDLFAGRHARSSPRDTRAPS